MNERLRTIAKWLFYELFILALWVLGPVRGQADLSTTLAVLLIMHAYPIYWLSERLGRR